MYKSGEEQESKVGSQDRAGVCWESYGLIRQELVVHRDVEGSQFGSSLSGTGHAYIL